MKTLASAVRFGTPLLVRDVERVDPVLNPVLNKELQRTGGRTLVRLGSEDVDFSPRFLIVLTTRDPAAQFTPDLCSRVTVVNFTVTPASLRSQALGLLLRAERPDVDKRRTQVYFLLLVLILVVVSVFVCKLLVSAMSESTLLLCCFDTACMLYVAPHVMR
jgi:dynein heavy chain 1, cytosolic